MSVPRIFTSVPSSIAATGVRSTPEQPASRNAPLHYSYDRPLTPAQRQLAPLHRQQPSSSSSQNVSSPTISTMDDCRHSTPHVSPTMSENRSLISNHEVCKAAVRRQTGPASHGSDDRRDQDQDQQRRLSLQHSHHVQVLQTQTQPGNGSSSSSSTFMMYQPQQENVGRYGSGSSEPEYFHGQGMQHQQQPADNESQAQDSRQLPQQGGHYSGDQPPLHTPVPSTYTPFPPLSELSQVQQPSQEYTSSPQTVNPQHLIGSASNSQAPPTGNVEYAPYPLESTGHGQSSQSPTTSPPLPGPSQQDTLQRRHTYPDLPPPPSNLTAVTTPTSTTPSTQISTPTPDNWREAMTKLQNNFSPMNNAWNALWHQHIADTENVISDVYKQGLQRLAEEVQKTETLERRVGEWQGMGKRMVGEYQNRLAQADGEVRGLREMVLRAQEEAGRAREAGGRARAQATLAGIGLGKTLEEKERLKGELTNFSRKFDECQHSALKIQEERDTLRKERSEDAVQLARLREVNAWLSSELGKAQDGGKSFAELTMQVADLGRELESERAARAEAERRVAEVKEQVGHSYVSQLFARIGELSRELESERVARKRAEQINSQRATTPQYLTPTPVRRNPTTPVSNPTSPLIVPVSLPREQWNHTPPIRSIVPRTPRRSVILVMQDETRDGPLTPPPEGVPVANPLPAQRPQRAQSSLTTVMTPVSPAVSKRKREEEERPLVPVPDAQLVQAPTQHTPVSPTGTKRKRVEGEDSGPARKRWGDTEEGEVQGDEQVEEEEGEVDEEEEEEEGAFRYPSNPDEQEEGEVPEVKLQDDDEGEVKALLLNAPPVKEERGGVTLKIEPGEESKPTLNRFMVKTRR